MIGIRKPSLHFYSKQIVFYEENSLEGLINLSERFESDRRYNHLDKPNYDSDTFLVVIDKYSLNNDFWRNIYLEKIGLFGIYNLIRIEMDDFNEYANILKNNGNKSSWRTKKTEKF